MTSDSKRIRDLGKFNWSMTEKYFDENLKKLFLESYLASRGLSTRGAFAQNVIACAESLAKNRNPTPY